MMTAKVSLVVLDITLKLLISAKYLVVLAELTFSWQIMYFAFLLVFCYVILVRLPPHPPPCEMLLIIFVFTLLTEEVRQVGIAKYWQKGFLGLRQFLLLRYGCCACVCWRLVSRHDFFFHVDQFLVQLIFYFIQRLQSYNPTSSKLNNLETVRIFKKKWPLPFSMWFDPLSEGGCNYKLNTSLKNIRLYDWPIAQIS